MSNTVHENSLFQRPLSEILPLKTLFGWCCGFLGFGFALGTYAGIGHAWLAAIELPLVGLLSVVITIPTLTVFTALISGTYSLRSTVYLALVTTATVGALLLALAPVMWLFASSSWFLSWPAMVATALGLASLFVTGWRISSQLSGGKSAYLLWILLLVPVTLQMATALRPIVTPQAPYGEERIFFLEHFGQLAHFRLPASASRN